MQLTVGEFWLRRKAGLRPIPSTFVGKHLRFTEDDLRGIVAAEPRSLSHSTQPSQVPGDVTTTERQAEMAATVAMLLAAPWETWAGVSGALGLATLRKLILERARCKTYRSILVEIGEGAVLVDESPGHRLVVMGSSTLPRVILTCEGHR